MEIECDLGSIHDENLLRKMWQQTEDLSRKKEIRSHLYKLRESRLKDFYSSGGYIMSGTAGFGKNPLTPSHGDSLADQSFESLKSKEISDFQSPTQDLNFHSVALTNPDSSGWDVQTSSEVSPDGRAFRSDTSAKTGGIEKISGGTAEYHGINEHHSSGSHEGDDKNFIRKADESSKTQLQERVVVGDDNSGLTEIKQSSSSSSSRSQYIASSTTAGLDGGHLDSMNYLEDDGYNRKMQHQLQKERKHEESEIVSSNKKQHHQQQQNQTDDFLEQNKAYSKLDKSSPEYQKRVQFLMAQQGEIISNTVEYVKPNVKMITTVKRLPDGTMVKMKNYETDGGSNSFESSTQKRYEKRLTEEMRLRENTDKCRPQSTEDHINAGRYDKNQSSNDFIKVERNNASIDDVTYLSNIEQKQNFVGERRSEIIEEVDEHFQKKSKAVPDFTTHGFPSVRSETPTRDAGLHLSKPTRDSTPKKSEKTPDFTTHGFPSVRPDKSTQALSTENTYSRQETFHETETVMSSSNRKASKPDFTTQGFPSVRSETPTRDVGSRVLKPNRDSAPKTPDFTTHGFPSARPTEKTHSRQEIFHETETIILNNNKENPKPDFTTHGFPSVRSETPTRDVGSRTTYPTRGSTPKRSEPTQDFTTHGFPSVRSDRPTQEFSTKNTHSRQETFHETETVMCNNNRKSPKPDFTAHGLPAVSDHTVPDGQQILINKEKTTAQSKVQYEGLSSRKLCSTEDFSTHGFPSVRPDRPTQEFPTDRPHSRQEEHHDVKNINSGKNHKTSQPDFTTQGFPSVINDDDKSFLVKEKSKKIAKSEVIMEKYNVKKGTSPKTTQPISNEGFSTHGFPSVKPDRPTQEFPTDRPHSRQEEYHANELHSIQVSTQQKETQKLMSQHVEQDDFITEDDYASAEVTDGRRSKNPDDDVPQMFCADLSPRKSNPRPDFTTNGFPSKESKCRTTTAKTIKSDFSTNGFPSVKPPTTPSSKQRRPSNDSQLDDTSSVKSYGSTEIIFHRETKVDAAHQAFASSLRCSSPADGTRRDSISSNQKHQSAARTSVGSVKSIHNRDVRSPSHESVTPSEGSRISTSTVTRPVSGRHTPSDTRKSSILSKQSIIKTKSTNNDSNVEPKSFVSKKTTTSTVKKPIRSVTPKADSLITKTTKQFPINEPLTITKNTFTENNANGYLGNEVVEEPIIKKSYYRLGPSANQPQSFEKTSSHSPLYKTRSPNTQYTKLDIAKNFTQNSETGNSSPKSGDKPTHSYEISPSPARKQSISPNRTSHRFSRSDNDNHNHELKTVPPDYTDEETFYDETVDTKTLTKNKTNSSTITKEDTRLTSVERKEDHHSRRSDELYSATREPHFEGPKVISDSVERFDVDSRQQFKNSSNLQGKVKKLSEEFIENEKCEEKSLSKKKFPNESEIIEQKSPITRKSVLQRSETYEERCRQILGMEQDENQLRKGIKKLNSDVDGQIDSNRLQQKTTLPEQKSHAELEVKIEDCYDDSSFEDNTTVPNLQTTRSSPSKTTVPNSSAQNTEADGLTFSKENPNEESAPITDDIIFENFTDRDQKHRPTIKQPVRQACYDNDYSKEEMTFSEKVIVFGVHEKEAHVEGETKRTVSPDIEVTSTRKSPAPGETKYFDYEPEETNSKRKPSTSTPRDAELFNQTDRKPSPIRKSMPPKIVDEYSCSEPKSIPIAKQLFPKELESPHGKMKSERKQSSTRKMSATPNSPTHVESDRRESRPKNVYQKDDEQKETYFTETKISSMREKIPRKMSPTGKNLVNNIEFSTEKNTKAISESRHSISPNSKKFSPTRLDAESPEHKSDSHHVEQINIHDERTIAFEGVSKPKESFRRSVTSPIRKPDPIKQKTVKATTTVVTKNQERSPRKPSSSTSPTRKQSSSSLIEVEKRPTNSSNQMQSSRNISKQKMATETRRKSSIESISSPAKNLRPSKIVVKTRKSSQTSLSSSPTNRSPERHADYYSSNNSMTQVDSKSTHVTTARIEVSPPASPLKLKPHNESKPLTNATVTATMTTTTKTSKFPQSVPSPKKDSPENKKQKFIVTDRKESAPVHRVTKRERDLHKASRSTSEHIIKSADKTDNIYTSALSARPSSRTERRPSKCLTTKTINLTATNRVINSEDIENVVIDIQQAKSSREPSPNKIVPTPVSQDMYTGKPRYPDVVQEPEDEPRKRPIIQNIPIFEEETNEYVGCQISEVNTDKINSITLTDNLDYTQDEESIIVKPEIIKNSENYLLFERTVDDDCLLSVHDKVSKFIHTAEEVNKPKASGPFCRDYTPTPETVRDDECLLTVDEKVTKFTKSAKQLTNSDDKSMSTYVPLRHTRPNSFINDESELSVSEKVNKFMTTAKKLAPTTPQRSPELVAKIEKQISRQGEVNVESENNDDDEEVKMRRTSTSNRYNFAGQDKIEREAKWEKDILSRPSVWDRNKKPVADNFDVSPSRVTSIFEGEKITSKESQSTTPRYSYKPTEYTEDEHMTGKTMTFEVTTGSTVLRSSESTSPIRKLTSSGPPEFNRKPSLTTIMTPSKPTKKDDEKLTTAEPSYVSTVTSSTKRIDNNEIHYNSQLQDNNKTPITERPLASLKKPTTSAKGSEISPEVRSPLRSKFTTESIAARRNLFERGDTSSRAGSTTPTFTTPVVGKRPSYMEHTKSSLEHTRRDSIELTKTNYSRKSSMEDDNAQTYDIKSTVKFNVEPKRRDSSAAQVKKRTSSSEIPHIEEIFDLALLEQMLNVVTSYEQRRRIRAQIRLVKKKQQQQQTKKPTTETTASPTKKPSAEDYTDAKKFSTKATTTSTVTSTTTNGHLTSVVSSTQRSQEQRSQNNFEEIDCSTATESYHREGVQSPREKSRSPTRKTSEIQNAEQKKDFEKRQKTILNEKKNNMISTQPIWANRKNVLKSERSTTATKKIITAEKPTVNGNRIVPSSMTTRSTQQQRTAADEDCITSSYGIGPTDENGLPLFGIRALKKKSQPSETTTVTGMVITEKYYSDNKTKPVHERNETIYSTDANELEKFEKKFSSEGGENIKSSKNESVTRKFKKIEKYPYDEESNAVVGMDLDADEFSSMQTSVVRRGSVKEMSEKFIRKESTQSVNEKSISSGYPKAGLILRTNAHSGATADAADNFETRSKYQTPKTKTTKSVHDDTDNELDECEIEEICKSSRKHSRVVTESESESESVQIIKRKVNKSTKSFLNSVDTKISGVEDVLERMRNADNVVEDGDTQEDREARALLNKFLGASVIMSGIETVLPQSQIKTSERGAAEMKQEEEIKTTRVTQTITTGNSSSPVAQETCDFEEIRDEKLLKELLEKSTTYEERRKIRARIRQLMAEREVYADVEEGRDKADLENDKFVNKKEKSTEKSSTFDDCQRSSASDEYEEIIEEVTDSEEEGEKSEEIQDIKKSEEVIKPNGIELNNNQNQTNKIVNVIKEEGTVNEELLENSVQPIDKEKKESFTATTTTEKTDTKKEGGAILTTTTKVTTRSVTEKPKSPFTKFKQLDEQNNGQFSKSPSTPPTTPGCSSKAQPIFKFTDPALNARAATVKEQLLQWCQMKTKEYENVEITNFSTSWTDGLAFCALIHHFLPDAFDYSKLTKQKRRENFELAFRVADEKAGIAPLLDVEDMVVMKRPDWKCVFVYVQSIYRRFRNCQ